MRLIDADALFEPNENTDKVLICGGRTAGKTIALAERLMRERVNMAPTLTLDDLRPKGRWEQYPEDWREQIIGGKCSLCGFAYYGNRFNFCPSCGADMREKKNG